MQHEIMKKLSILLVSALMLTSVCSCTSFDELNTDPDATTKVSPEMIATNLILNIATPSTAKGFFNSSFMMKYMAWGEGPATYQYNKFGRSGFGAYYKLISAQKMVELAKDYNQEAYIGLAKFVEAYKMYYLTMEVGDIPYSDALKGEEGGIKPIYDTQKDVMLRVLQALEESYANFSIAKDFDGDPMMGGSVERWKKAVTAFQLKVLLNLSLKVSDPDLNVKARFANIVANSTLMESNADNFQVVFSAKKGQRYPTYKDDFNYNAYPMLSITLVDVLKKFKDYRLFYYAEPAASKTEAGIAADSWDAYIGVDPSKSNSDIMEIFGKKEFCNINLRYKEKPEGEPFITLGYAEQNFILAEAALRGWISGPADTYYKKGIEASMRFIADNTADEYCHNHKITDAYIAEYLNSPEIQLTEGRDNGLEMLLTQRYLAAFLHFPWDAYYDHRRTGYPEMPMNVETNQNEVSTQFPKRWMYPQSELDYNSDNVKEAIQRQYGGEDNHNSLMWILKE